MFDCCLFGGVASFVVAADLNINVFWFCILQQLVY
jgi:hypothetical protein